VRLSDRGLLDICFRLLRRLPCHKRLTSCSEDKKDSKMSRPELIAPPELFYDEKEASKYTGNTRIIAIQTAMAERCLELLNFPDDSPKLILDIGCGSGLSGDVVTEAGHSWVGLDISPSMLDIAVAREVEGDTCLADMGQGFGFRAGMFDGVIR
jgi:18S rRNA (guanine1575-N7)-methyltransferase